MPEITEILEAFTQGRIDFAGLFQGIDEIASEDPTQIPELITQLEGLYRQGRLPPQLYNTLRFHLQGVLTPDETPATTGPSEPAPGTLMRPIVHAFPPAGRQPVVPLPRRSMGMPHESPLLHQVPPRRSVQESPAGHQPHQPPVERLHRQREHHHPPLRVYAPPPAI